MRISMDENDPAYDPYRAFGAKVFLDGVELKNCLTADEEFGAVQVLAPIGETLQRATLYGVVKVVLDR
jgi:hypothetical protein